MIRAECVGVERLLRIAHQRNVRLYNVKRVSYTAIVATMSTVGYARLQRAAREDGRLRITLLRAGGAYRLLAFLKRRWLLPVGALVMLAALVAASMMCFDVRVEGTVAEGDYALYTLIEENGGVPFVPKGRIDTEKIEEAIRARWPNTLYVNARFDGTTLVVQVDEGAPIPPVLEDNPASVYATCRAVVESVTVGEGMAAVAAGDVVEQGDLLIAGRYEKNEFQYDVHARGQVIGRVDYLGSGTAAYSTVEYVRTGNTATARFLQLGARRIQIEGKNPFDSFETEERQTASLGQNYPVHGDVIEVVYYETEARPSEKNRELAITQATEAAYFDALSKMDGEAEGELIDFFSYVQEEDGVITVSATVAMRQDIGQTAESQDYFTQKEEADSWN